MARPNREEVISIADRRYLVRRFGEENEFGAELIFNGGDLLANCRLTNSMFL